MTYNESIEKIIAKEHQELSLQEKSDYAQLCKKSIIKHIKDNTGDSCPGVEIDKIVVHAETLIPQIEYKFESSSDLSVVPDRMPHSSVHSLVTDKNEMISRMSAQQQSDFNDNEIRVNIEKSLEDNIYGRISNTIEVYDNPMMWIYHYQCNECNGIGTNQCTTCNGYGTIQCSKCKGNGNIQCTWCHGTGRLSNVPNERAYNEPCNRCSGTGILRCGKCKGRGYEVCFKCNGAGKIKCEHCLGTGWLTMIGRTFINATPTYLINFLNSASDPCKSAINKIGTNDIHLYTALRRYDSYRKQSDSFVVRYIGRLIVAEAEVKINGKNSKWILAGNNASIIDAGDAIDNIMGEKISDLSNHRVSLLNPWGDARKKIDNFMSYDINHKIIEASLDDDNPQVIRNLLNNSVSEQYISESMEALIGIIKGVKSVNRCFFAILFAILPCVIAYSNSPVYIKLDAGLHAGFIEMLPFLIVVIAVPALSAVLIAWFLNNWYNSRDKNLLRVWSKKRNLVIIFSGTENKKSDNFFDTITFWPGFATYMWILAKILYADSKF